MILLSEIGINHLKRTEGASVKEITIGGKTLKSLQTVPKFQSKLDIDLFVTNLKQLPIFDGVAFDLYSIPSIFQSINFTEGQRTLDSMSIAKTPAKKMIDDRLCFIDPNTEWYRYKYITKVEGKKGEKMIHTIQTDIFNQRGFPQAIKEIFLKRGTDGHNTAWRELEKNNLLLSFVLWHIEQNLKYNSNLIIPPTPIVDGKNLSMLDIANNINNIAKEYAFEHTDIFRSYYLPIHPDAFKEDIRCKRILNIIRNNLLVNSIIVLKFFRIKKVIMDPFSRSRLSRFLSTLDNIKKSYMDSIAIMVLDTKEEGFALMSNSVDITCDPLGGIKDNVPFKKAKKDDGEGSGDEKDINPYKNFGKFIHPDTREYTKINDLMNTLDTHATLPHDCFMCRTLHGRIKPNCSEFPSSSEWNLARRLHNFNFRREEDSWLSDAVIDNNIKGAETYLSQRNRANKNLVDLLPSSIFD